MQPTKQIVQQKAMFTFTALELFKDFWLRFKKNRAAVMAMFMLIIFVFIAFSASWLTPYDPFSVSRQRFEPPSVNHWAGTDNLGRDVLSRIIHGTSITILIGFSVGFIAITFGTIIGALAGFFGGKIDALLMRFLEMFQIIPVFFLAIVVVALLGGGIDRIIIVLAVLSWPRSARVVRAEFLSYREREFVEAAKALGFGKAHIIFSEILPNVLPLIFVVLSMNIATAILVEAGLSFLGLVDPSVITWGQMLRDAQQWLTDAWWISVFPGIAIFLAVLSFNLFGDGLTDALNPYLKER